MSRFAQLKQDMRRTVHDTFAVDATYQSSDMLDPVSLRVRFHTKRENPFGDLGGEGYAVVIENADRAVFDAEELAAKSITPVPNAVINFIEYGICLRLGVRDPRTGPLEQIWTLAR